MAGDNPENKDASMLDVSEAASNTTINGKHSADSTNEASLAYTFSQMNVDNPNELEPQHPLRHKSSLIFNDDDDDEIPPYSNHAENGSGETFDSDDDIDASSSSSIDSNEGDIHDADMTGNTLQKWIISHLSSLTHFKIKAFNSNKNSNRALRKARKEEL